MKTISVTLTYNLSAMPGLRFIISSHARLATVGALLLMVTALACSSEGDPDEVPDEHQTFVPEPTADPVPETAAPEPTAQPAPETLVPEPTAQPAPETVVPEPTEDLTSESESVKTPELAGLEGWTNSEPFTIAERTEAGEVVLIDFWTYTCVNCIRTFPFLREWHEKYADLGLTILGVHSPEFEFEKARDGVLRSLERFDIQYPVAQDNERGTWNAFENRAWPAKYLFGADGSLLFEHIGEGDYIEIEHEIRDALMAAGRDISGVPVGVSNGPDEDETAFYLTGELYTGYRKVYGLSGALSLAPIDYYLESDRAFDYEDSEFHHFNKVYLQGRWLNEKDVLVHARETMDLEDYLYAYIFARTGNIVVEHRGESPIDVYVELDGEPVPRDGAGADLVYDESGASLIRVDESRLYTMFQLPQFGQHEMTVRSNSDQFAVSAFTFGNYVEGP